MTLRELAEIAGISATYVSFMENGLQPGPRSSAPLAVAEALNVPESVLFPERH